MPYSVKILADSVSDNGTRLTTWELQYPRYVHAELLTHRVFSKNSASSRAIPSAKLIERIETDPALPLHWGKNQPGMQAHAELEGNALFHAQKIWLEARDEMLSIVESLNQLGLHKQLANRLLEPWMFITVILTSTEYDNFFRLRAHPDAQPEIAWVATEMKRQYESATPTYLPPGAWHMPLIRDEDYVECFDERNPEESLATLRKISVARCARVSYLTHDGRKDFSEDVKLHDRLLASGHMSPFEHVAQAQLLGASRWSGNFRNWSQYRETVDAHFQKTDSLHKSKESK